MSTRDSRFSHLRHVKIVRKRNPILDLDLNSIPPIENQDQEETSTHNRPQDVQPVQLEDVTPSTVIDLEAFDDDVMISSPRAFAEAKNKFRKKRDCNVVVDLDSEELSCKLAPNNRNKRRKFPVKRTIINCDLYINQEGSSKSTAREKNTCSVAPPTSSLPPSPKEPTFNCPVCMCPLVEPMSTKCGHIFCKVCLKTALGAKNKCPACRRKVTMKDTFRVYLPGTT